MRLIVLNQKNSRLKIKKLIFDWNKMVTYPNFKRDYKSLWKSSLFFLTTSGTAELNQSETRFPLGLQEIQHMLELQYLCSFHKN